MGVHVCDKVIYKDRIQQARLAQSVEHQTSSEGCGFKSHLGQEFFILYFVTFDALLTGRLVPCKWNQAWRPPVVYRCIEREKDNFKSRELKRLKECALALSFKLSVVCKIWRPYGLVNRLVIQGSWIRVPLWTRIFHFVILGFRSLQPEQAHANEINHDKLRANTLF